MDETGRLRGWRDYPWKDVMERSLFALKQDVRLLDKGMSEVFYQGCADMLKRRKLKVDDIDWFLPHYSSEYFRDKLFAHLPEQFKIPQSRWFTNLPRVGNVGSASLYLMLGELFSSGSLKKGERLLCFVPESGRFSMAFVHLTVVDASA
jgi:3-oxoacyl-[acyl-carrier-protein] synthase-3